MGDEEAEPMREREREREREKSEVEVCGSRDSYVAVRCLEEGQKFLSTSVFNLYIIDYRL